MNWQTFWAAVEALATVGALVFLGFQLYAFRKEITARKKEIAARKVEGLRYAREQLESEDFRGWLRIIIDLWKTGGKEYPEGVTPYLVNALTRIDFVAKLIELDYVDKDLLFYLFANDLVLIERAITNFDHRENSKIPGIRASFPNGYALLKKAAKASSEKSKEGFERLDKDKAT